MKGRICQQYVIFTGLYGILVQFITAGSLDGKFDQILRAFEEAGIRFRQGNFIGYN